MLLYFTTTLHKEDELYYREDKTAEPVTRKQQKQSALRAFKCKELQNAHLSSNYIKKNNFGIFSYFYVLIKLLKTIFVCTIEKLYSKDALNTSVSKIQCVKMQIAIMFRL